MYIIHTQKLAGWLMQRGFVLQKLEPDKKNSGRNIFLFKDSNELREAIERFNK